MLSAPLIYPISEGLADESNFGEQLSRIMSNAIAAAEVGVALFQVREKQLSAKLLFELTVAIVRETKATGLRVVVNGRPDVALAAGASGVHLPANGLPIADVRRTFGSGLLIGASCHIIEELSAARENGADFATFGPIFASPGKGEPKGISGLHSAAAVEGLPVLALGGVSIENVGEVAASGAAGVAAIRALSSPEKIVAFARRMEFAFNERSSESLS